MSKKKDMRSKRDQNYYDVKQRSRSAMNKARRLQKRERRVTYWKHRRDTIFALVADHFRGEKGKAGEWFAKRNPLLGGVAPNTMLRLHRYERLEKFIKNQLSENAKELKNADLET